MAPAGSQNEKPVLSISVQADPPFPGFDTFYCDLDDVDDLHWIEVLRT